MNQVIEPYFFISHFPFPTTPFSPPFYPPFHFSFTIPYHTLFLISTHTFRFPNFLYTLNGSTTSNESQSVRTSTQKKIASINPPFHPGYKMDCTQFQICVPAISTLISLLQLLGMELKLNLLSTYSLRISPRGNSRP